MSTSKITRNFQVTIPQDIRQIQHLKEGDNVLFVSTDEEVIMKKASKEIIKACVGIWKNMKESSADYISKFRKESEERLRRLGL